MIHPRAEAFPLGAVTHLLSILRELYRTERAAGATPDRLEAIAAVGRELSAAADIARRAGPGSIGQAAAWNRAERATEAFCGLVSDEQRTKAAPDLTRVRRWG